MWELGKAADAHVGTDQYTARINKEADEKVRDTHINNMMDLDPYTYFSQKADLNDIIMIIIFFVGR